MYLTRLLLFCTSMFCSYNAMAFYNDTKYTPASMQGYTTYGYASRIGDTSDMPSYSAYTNDDTQTAIEQVRSAKVRQIQDKYAQEGVENLADEVEMVVTDEDVSDSAKGYKRNKSTQADAQEVTSEAFERICYDLGFNQDTQRDSLAFHECVSQGMKTKLTEETNDKTPYNVIDVNIVKALSSNTLLDKTVEGFVPYEEMVTQRNKLDCLKKADYYKCVNTVTAYKQCYNQVIDYATVEHEKNKIICYTKAGIKFADPDAKEEYVRDAYFGMCIHLIEQDLKKVLMEQNAQCNQLLIKKDLLGMVI